MQLCCTSYCSYIVCFLLTYILCTYSLNTSGNISQSRHRASISSRIQGGHRFSEFEKALNAIPTNILLMIMARAVVIMIMMLTITDCFLKLRRSASLCFSFARTVSRTQLVSYSQIAEAYYCIKDSKKCLHK